MLAELTIPKKEPPSVPDVATVDENGKPYTHTVEPELRSATIPRPAKLTPQNQRTRYLIWSIPLGILCVILYFAYRTISTQAMLFHKGTVIHATVTGKTINGSDNDIYYFHYRFLAEGTYDCSGSVECYESKYNSKKIGDTIRVTYLTGSKGRIWEPGQMTWERVSGTIAQQAYITVMLVIFAGLLIVFHESEWRKNLYYLRNGIIAQGVVVSGTVREEEGIIYRLTYSFPVGKRLKTSTIHVSKAEYIRYTTGNPYFTVLYHGRRFVKSKPYFQIMDVQLLDVDRA